MKPIVTGSRNLLKAAFQPGPADWRELRERHELSQAGLARYLKSGGIGVRSIQAYEARGRKAHPSTWRYVLAQMGELRLPEQVKGAA